MKSIIAALCLTMSGQVFALSATDSWETILATRNIKTEGTIAFSAGDSIAFVSVFEVCSPNSSQYMTIDPQNIIKVSYNGHNSVETVVGTERLVGSNSYTVMVRKGGGSSGDYVPLTREIPRDQNIDVFYKNPGSSAGPAKLFSKAYRIPDCL